MRNDLTRFLTERFIWSAHTQQKYSTSLLITGVQTKSLYSYRVAQMTKFKEGDHIKCWWGCGVSRVLGIVYRSAELVLPVLQRFCWDMTYRWWLCQGSASWVGDSTASMHSISISLLSLKASSFSTPKTQQTTDLPRQCPAHSWSSCKWSQCVASYSNLPESLWCLHVSLGSATQFPH